MTPLIRHALIPAFVALVFFYVATMPVEVLGCRNRGLLAAVIALGGALTSLILMIFTLIKRTRHNTPAGWNLVSALILAVPAIYILLLTSI